MPGGLGILDSNLAHSYPDSESSQAAVSASMLLA